MDCGNFSNNVDPCGQVPVILSSHYRLNYQGKLTPYFTTLIIAVLITKMGLLVVNSPSSLFFVFVILLVYIHFSFIKQHSISLLRIISSTLIIAMIDVGCFSSLVEFFSNYFTLQQSIIHSSSHYDYFFSCRLHSHYLLHSLLHHLFTCALSSLFCIKKNQYSSCCYRSSSCPLQS